MKTLKKMSTRQTNFLNSDLCKGIKSCYVVSTYKATGKYPTDNKLNLYLDRVYYYFNKSNLLEDFNL